MVTRERQLMHACDFDAQLQMEQVECVLASLMDERAAADDAIEHADHCVVVQAATCVSPSTHTSSSDSDVTSMDANDRVLNDASALYNSDDASSDDQTPPTSPIDSLHSDDNDQDDARSAPVDAVATRTLALELLNDDDRPVQWDLISPWSESSEQDYGDDDADDAADAAEPAAAPTRVFFGADSAAPALFTINEPPTNADVHTDDDGVEDDDCEPIEVRLQALIQSESDVARTSDSCTATVERNNPTWPLTNNFNDDDDDDEFDVLTASLDSFHSNSHTDSLVFVDERHASSNNVQDELLDDSARTSVATTTMTQDDESSPRAAAALSSASRFAGRRAQSYAGAATVAGMQTAFAKLRSRTLSTASSYRRSTAPSFTQRNSNSNATSELESMELADNSASERESDVRGSSFDSQRGSSLSSRPTLVARFGSVGSLRMSSKMGSLLRFRTSSATTTTSEESDCCVDAPVASDALQSLATSQSIASLDAAVVTPLQDGLLQSHSQTTQSQHAQQQMQALKLKASAAASKAAGYLNVASSEAARKLKSRTMRGAKQPSARRSNSTSSVEESEERRSSADVGNA